MHPLPPKRSDSAKFVSSGFSETPSLSQMPFEDYRLSYIQSFGTESPMQQSNPMIAGTVPPLASYSPDASPKAGRKSTIATGYVASQGFQGHYRHPNGNTSMLNLSSYSSTPPLTPRKNTFSSSKVISNIGESKIGGFEDLSIKASLPKKEEEQLRLADSSQMSVEDFMVKLLRFDDEPHLTRKAPLSKSYSRRASILSNVDISKESIQDILKVTLLEAEASAKKSFDPPKSSDLDPQLNSSNRGLDNWAVSTAESKKILPIPVRSSSKYTPSSDKSSSSNNSVTYQRSFETLSAEKSLPVEDLSYQQMSINTTSKSVPAISQDASPISDSMDIDMHDAKSTSSIYKTEYLMEKTSTIDSTSSSFDQKSSNTDSSTSSIHGSEVYKPTFQTLRRNKQVSSGSLSENSGYVPSDASFSQMKETAKKSNNPQVQFDFAKYCIQLGDPYADTGLFYLQKLAKSGFADAQYVLGQAYADDRRYDIAFRYFSAATKRNHYEAAFEAAYLCEHGAAGIKKNEREALNYYRKAGLAGHKKAMYRLALAELYGQLGLKRNINNGMKWLNRGEAVADQDCPEPLYELSLIYEVGIYPVVIADADHSLSLLRQAAELEYPPAQYKLGYCYEYGYLGVSIDKTTSITLYQVAAKAGNKEAQLALSGWLISGYESFISRNEREAFYWAHLSALQGLARAEYTMGYFLESGIGVSANISEAIKWYKLASLQGDEMALKRLSEIGPYLPKSPRKSKLFNFF